MERGCETFHDAAESESASMEAGLCQWLGRRQVGRSGEDYREVSNAHRPLVLNPQRAEASAVQDTTSGWLNKNSSVILIGEYSSTD